MKITQIRNATVIIEYHGLRFLVDPWLQEYSPEKTEGPLTMYSMKPTVPLPVPMEEIISGLDGVLVTHTHRDHFDEMAARKLDKSLPVVVGNALEKEKLWELGFTHVSNLEKDKPPFEGIHLYRVDGQHGSSPKHTAGKVCGFVLTSEMEKTLYIAGDTVYYDGVRSVLQQYDPDVILINACGAVFPDGDRMIMDCRDVEDMCRSVSDATLIASHMETVPHATVTREQLRIYLKRRNLKNRVLIPADGETLTFCF